MPKRTFATQQLIDWGVHEWDECEHVLEMEHDGMNDFEVECHLVLKAPDDGRLWRIDFQINNGADYNDFIGISHGDNLRPERPSFTGIEVEPRQKTVTYYEPITDPEPPSVQVLRALLALIMAKTGGRGGPFDIDLSDVPSDETLEELDDEEREEVASWAATCHAEASDNDVRAGPCPECLRRRLLDDHPYKTWRVG